MARLSPTHSFTFPCLSCRLHPPSLVQNVLCEFPPQLQSLLATDPAAFDGALAPYLASSLGLQGMVYFGALGTFFCACAKLAVAAHDAV